MDSKNIEDQKVEVNFESHPPIETDLHGISALLRQTLLQFVDCNGLARYLLELKDTTQVIALEEPDEENMDEDDEPDNDIYGVSSVIDIPANRCKEDSQMGARVELAKFLMDKNPHVKDLLSANDGSSKLCVIINERYINLPPQLALPTLKSLSEHIDREKFTHLIFISKILVRSKQRGSTLPSKKVKSPSTSSDEALVFVNSEEEVIYENCENHSDINVSSLCDENATWSLNNDTKYIPYRRIMVVKQEKWPTILKLLDKELSC